MSQSKGVKARAKAVKKFFTSKAKLQKHFRILILDEGPTLPDLDHDAIDALMGGPDAGGRWQPINHPGWPVSLPGALLTKIAPVMMVMAKVLPLIVKAATGLSLPDFGIGGPGTEQIAALSTAWARRGLRTAVRFSTDMSTAVCADLPCCRLVMGRIP